MHNPHRTNDRACSAGLNHDQTRTTIDSGIKVHLPFVKTFGL